MRTLTAADLYHGERPSSCRATRPIRREERRLFRRGRKLALERLAIRLLSALGIGALL